jgi:FAD:protein FMN transferase
MQAIYTFEETIFRSLGTDINIKIILAENRKSELAKKTLVNLEFFYTEKEKIFSRFDSESELSKLNRNTGKYVDVSCDIIEVAKKTLDYYKKTGGFFDPRVLEVLEGVGYDKDFKKINSSDNGDLKNLRHVFHNKLKDDLKIENDKILFNRRMDFSGIAKGYINDKATDFLKNRGYKNFLVDSGGDMYAAGFDERKKPWEISIEGVDEDKLSFNLSNVGIATSGITRRKWEGEGKKFHHLINPKKPQEFLFDLKSVTVVDKNTEKADILAKTLFLMGKERGIEFSEENEIASIFLDYKGNIYLSKEIKKYLKNKL